jgi:hypothetical protein
MSTAEGSGHAPLLPAVEICQALVAAQNGDRPTFTQDSLLHSLRLDGENPDGLALVDRLSGGKKGFTVMRAVVSVIKPTIDLLRATNEHTANPAQEELALALGAVVTRQVRREGDVCPGASMMAQSSTREDIIPIDVKLRLADIEATPRPNLCRAIFC